MAKNPERFGTLLIKQLGASVHLGGDYENTDSLPVVLGIYALRLFKLLGEA